jgi:hypothetical protein
MKGKSVPEVFWSAWCRRKPRSKWQCVVRCAGSKDHAIALLDKLTQRQYVESCILPAGREPQEGLRP